jgi:hypothetical protein
MGKLKSNVQNKGAVKAAPKKPASKKVPAKKEG